MKLVTDELLQTMTERDKLFFDFLSSIHVRVKSDEHCKPLGHEDNDKAKDEAAFKALLSIGDVGDTGNTGETEPWKVACDILKEVYNDYRTGSSSGKRTLPELIARCIHYIIYRVNFDNFGSKNKCVSASEVLKTIGTPKNALAQMGIDPAKDYFMWSHESIKFNSHKSNHRDEVFNIILFNLLFFCDFAMFIDISGEDTILKDFHCCNQEVVCSDDCMAVNFYNALIYEFEALFEAYEALDTTGDFEDLREARRELDELTNDTDEYKEAEKKHNAILEQRKETLSEYKDVLDKKREKHCIGGDSLFSAKYPKWVNDPQTPTLPTFPIDKDAIDIYAAAMYWFMLLNDRNKNIEESKSMLVRLGKRLKDTVFGCIKTDDLFKVLNRDKARYAVFTEKGYKYDTYNYYNGTTTVKGLIFYDFNLRRDDLAAFHAFKEFVKADNCNWIFVCKQKDGFLLEYLRGEKVHIVSFNQDSFNEKDMLFLKYHIVIQILFLLQTQLITRGCVQLLAKA